MTNSFRAAYRMIPSSVASGEPIADQWTASKPSSRSARTLPIRPGLTARPFLFRSNHATPVLHLGKTIGTKTDIQMQKAIYVTCTVSQGVFESEFYVTVNDSSVYASTLPSTSSPF